MRFRFDDFDEPFAAQNVDWCERTEWTDLIVGADFYLARRDMRAFVGESFLPTLAGLWLSVLKERIASADEKVHLKPKMLFLFVNNVDVDAAAQVMTKRVP